MPEAISQQVILVDSNDQPIGTAEKILAHEQGWLHRAFSVFVLRKHNNQIEMLLQQRQTNKYHAGGLWTNTCCSHPQPGETVQQSAERRLQEELGFTLPLTEIGSFTYRAEFSNGLIEHEVDHVLIGEYKDSLSIEPNPNEVMDYRWISLSQGEQEAKSHPELYTPWFLEALNIVSQHSI
jgi:isopentenyl-diphosphate delta-isomerase type 1